MRVVLCMLSNSKFNVPYLVVCDQQAGFCITCSEPMLINHISYDCRNRVSTTSDHRRLRCSYSLTMVSGIYHNAVSIVYKTHVEIYHVIVIARGPGIYSSKRTESEGKARGQVFFTVTNPWQPIAMNTFFHHSFAESPLIKFTLNYGIIIVMVSIRIPGNNL